MADESGLSPFVFACQGGLVLDQSTFVMQPGMALELENFEPDVQGGYRRISGYEKWISGEVPYTASATEKVLMSAHYGTEILAARGEKVFRSSNATTTLDGAVLVGAGVAFLIFKPIASLVAYGAIAYGAWTIWNRE